MVRVVGWCYGQFVFCLFAGDVVAGGDCGGLCVRGALYGASDDADLSLASSPLGTGAGLVGSCLWIGVDELPSAPACGVADCLGDRFASPFVSLLLPLGWDSVRLDGLRADVGCVALG